MFSEYILHVQQGLSFSPNTHDLWHHIYIYICGVCCLYDRFPCIFILAYGPAEWCLSTCCRLCGADQAAHYWLFFGSSEIPRNLSVCLGKPDFGGIIFSSARVYMERGCKSFTVGCRKTAGLCWELNAFVVERMAAFGSMPVNCWEVVYVYIRTWGCAVEWCVGVCLCVLCGTHSQASVVCEVRRKKSPLACLHLLLLHLPILPSSP